MFQFSENNTHYHHLNQGKVDQEILIYDKQ